MIWRVIIFLTLSNIAFGQQLIDGTVVDKDTGKPIPFASLVIEGTSQGTSANLQGQFFLVVLDTFSLRVTCIGYETSIVRSVEEAQVIQLKAIATQLKEVYVFSKEINPKKIVRKAFASIPDNYDNESFLQKFFYRYYNKTESEYEKLIEASADVWKHDGYHSARIAGGEREELRITQLRRSLDIKGMVQNQKPIMLEYMLQSDIAGYQTALGNTHINIFDGASNLRTDFANYTFTFDGVTNYDGKEVYKIDYVYKKDSVLTTKGYKLLAQAHGSLFIATDTHAFIKVEDTKYDEFNTIHTSAYYRKHGSKYYPYHFIREGENTYVKPSSFHIELISLDIRHSTHEQFSGHEPGREELLKIPYDSTFWKTTSILKATPLEDEIIHDLGGGTSLNRQFYLYRQYEKNVTDGGKNGEEKFNWLKDISKSKRILYVFFWDSNLKSYLLDIEYMKQLNLLFRKQITFVLISLENDEAKWQQQVVKFNLFADGMVNYRVGDRSELTNAYKVREIPSFFLISKEGDVTLNAKRPKDPTLQADLRSMIEDVND